MCEADQLTMRMMKKILKATMTMDVLTKISPTVEVFHSVGGVMRGNDNGFCSPRKCCNRGGCSDISCIEECERHQLC